jgi:hypothetical protein
MAGMVGMAGMAERQKEWQNDKMAESGYIRTIYGTRRHNGGMVDWREWSNGRNGGNDGNGGTAERMAERKWLYTYYLWYTPTPTTAPTPSTTLKSFIV